MTAISRATLPWSVESLLGLKPATLRSRLEKLGLMPLQLFRQPLEGRTV